MHLLGRYPDVEARFHQELDSVLGGRPVTVDDIPSLPYTVKVIHESMRVFPPVWGFFRLMTTDYQLGEGGPVIPRGHLMGMSPWATHRDGRYWPDPLRFDPERWNKDATRPRELAYFPFSAGPYQCHGKELGDEGGRPDPRHARPALVLPARRTGAPAESRPGPRSRSKGARFKPVARS